MNTDIIKQRPGNTRGWFRGFTTCLWLPLLALPALGQQNASPAAEQKLRVAVERQAFLGCIEWLAQ